MKPYYIIPDQQSLETIYQAMKTINFYGKIERQILDLAPLFPRGTWSNDKAEEVFILLDQVLSS